MIRPRLPPPYSPCYGRVASIDFRTHRGEHPRIGAVESAVRAASGGSRWRVCTLAKEVGAVVANRFKFLSFFTRRPPQHRPGENLENIRRGGIRRAGRARCRQPGGLPISARRHSILRLAPSSSAHAPLIAYNINLEYRPARRRQGIAAAIRQSSGGLRYVKALGVMLEDRGLGQVSMNLTNYEKTPMFRVFELVETRGREIRRVGARERDRRVVPAAALVRAAGSTCSSNGFGPDQILENSLRADAEGSRLRPYVVRRHLSGLLFLFLVGLRTARSRTPASSGRGCCARRRARRPSVKCCPAAPQRAQDVVALESLARVVQRQRRRPGVSASPT